MSQILLWFLAPRRVGTDASIPEANSRLFVDRPDFFDYPDADQASLLAVAQFIGEKPVTFVTTGTNQLDRGACLPAGPGRTLLLSGRFRPWALSAHSGGRIAVGLLPLPSAVLHARVSPVSMPCPTPS